MQPKARRRTDAVLLGAGALVGGALTAIGAVAANNERITSMWVGASLRDDRSAGVVEVIDYTTGTATGKHGIVRRIPGITTSTPVEVSSETAPDGIAFNTPFSFDGGESGVELKIGDADTTISGQHRYRIRYDHTDLQTEAHALEFDAVGTGWPFEMDEVEVHVVAPWSFVDPTCQQGTVGSTTPCDVEQVEPGHLAVVIDHLDPHHGVTVRADKGTLLDAAPGLPAGPLRAPDDPGTGVALPAAVAVAGSLGGAFTASRLVRRAGRERVGTGGAADAAWSGGGGPASEVRMDVADLSDMATTEFAPPNELTPAQGGVVLSEGVENQHKVAWLIQAAIDGGIDLVERGKRGDDVTLVRTGEGRPEQRAILDTAFNGRDQIELGSYDSHFATGWAEVDRDLRSWMGSSGLWDPSADGRRLLVRGVGVLVMIVGAVVAIAGAYGAASSGPGFLPVVAVGAAVSGAGFAATVRGWELRVRTPRGSGLWLRIESFRRFLAASESFHAEEAAKRGVLREYTAWAVALGEIDRWQRSVMAAGAIPEAAGLGYVHLAPVLAHSTSATATAPSSSSSGGGFSGGGGVGGGGGGGGGGSW